MTNQTIEQIAFSTVYKYKDEYDAGIKDSNSGNEHCDFVERFAKDIAMLIKEHGEDELIRGFNKGVKNV